MKPLAFIALVVTLFVSLFHINGANLSNNTLAVAIMILLLVLFADLKEFNFWGLWGKKREEVKKIEEGSVVLSKKKPSRYKLAKAEKEDTPEQMMTPEENFLSASYEMERLMRVIARAIGNIERDVILTPESVLKTLVEKKFISKDTAESIQSVRQLRSQLLQADGAVHPNILAAGLQVVGEMYTELKRWLYGSMK